MAIPDAALELKFEYTIEDGDVNSPETDSADLTIHITPPSDGGAGKMAPEPSARSVEFELDDTSGSIDTFSHTQSNTGFEQGARVFAMDPEHDLSDVLSLTGSGSLDNYLNPDVQNDKVSFDLKTDNRPSMEQDVVLESADSEVEDASSTYVTNGLLAEGGIIISDAFAAPQTPLPEFDSQDVL